MFYNIALVAVSVMWCANFAQAQKFLKGMDTYKRSTLGAEYLVPITTTNPSVPVLDMKSPDMACRAGNQTLSAPKILEVASSDILYLTFDLENRPYNATALMKDANIWGPCMVYMAPAKPSVDNKYKWFKIYEWAGDKDQWCSEKIVTNDGVLAVPMKQFLKSDTYVIRAEIIGLNMAEKANSENSQLGAQFYPSCGMIKYTNEESTVMAGGNNGVPVGVPFPGYYKENHPALKLDIMTTKALTYPSKMAALGPPEYDPPAVAHDGGSVA
ncbi:hypothetical protein GGI20_002634 [Coemansia sp. BCRC 34301]|nr:hypothetical protein GGI20_002634 [Coemansia sp. BCRC 34301]